MSDYEKIFPGLFGGDRAKKLLGASLTGNHLVHNYLFEGPLGIGKFPFAISFARNIACPNRSDGAACRVCYDCRLIDRGHHPDVVVMSRESDLAVDESRRISEIVSLTPLRLNQKIVILDGIESMTTGAGNALLKTLEESPGKSIFILTTNRAEKLLPTIVSRSFRVPFFLMATKTLRDEYIRVLSVDSESAEHAAELSTGRPGWGIRFMLHPEFRNVYTYGKLLLSDTMLKMPLSKIFQIEKIFFEFMDKCAEVFNDDLPTIGMDGNMICAVMNGEEVKFKPVNLFTKSEEKTLVQKEEKETPKRTQKNVNALGMALLGGILRNMIAKGEVKGDQMRYFTLLRSFVESPGYLERNYNRDLVIERLILSSHQRFHSGYRNHI